MSSNLESAIFVTSTDTGVGKTFFSIKIIEDLITKHGYNKKEICYYKPVQCGEELSETGSKTDFGLVQEKTGVDVFCSYFLKHPASPHFAAELEGITINLDKIREDFLQLKQKYSFIVVEGAGGIAVPLNKCKLISDLIVHLDLPVVIVTRPDLGTINHTLLTIGHAKKKNLRLLGLLVCKPSLEPDQYSINDKKFVQERQENSIQTICEMMELGLFDLTSITDTSKKSFSTRG